MPPIQIHYFTLLKLACGIVSIMGSSNCGTEELKFGIACDPVAFTIFSCNKYGNVRGKWLVLTGHRKAWYINSKDERSA